MVIKSFFARPTTRQRMTTSHFFFSFLTVLQNWMIPTAIKDILIRNLLIPSLKHFTIWEPNGKGSQQSRPIFGLFPKCCWIVSQQSSNNPATFLDFVYGFCCQVWTRFQMVQLYQLRPLRHMYYEFKIINSRPMS